MGRQLNNGRLSAGVFSTGQVARLLGCSTRTVSLWAKEGDLPSHKLPGSRHLRFDRADLVRFLRETGQFGPLRKLLPGVEAPLAALLVGLGSGLSAAVKASTDLCSSAGGLFAAGLYCARGGVGAVVLDDSLGRREAAAAAEALAGGNVRVLALLSEDAVAAPWHELGVETLEKPVAAEKVVEFITRALGEVGDLTPRKKGSDR